MVVTYHLNRFHAHPFHHFLVTYNYFRMQSADLEYARCLKLKSDRDAAGKDRMAAKAIQEGHLTAGDGNML